ncbi:MAG: electron transfer flavoprotein subunit alpha/FixB family protein [Streptosporangiales bacterium]|nr:electron transfer flavoprotein subunit alpha/FixB family protein [Streptosporangiales bacterium]
MSESIAVVPVRGGMLPVGADEAVAEAGGVALLAGSGVAKAAPELPAVRVLTAELGAPAFRAWAAVLAPALAPYGAVLLPASPDGRDLAPRLAAELGRPLLAGATEIRGARVLVARRGGLLVEEVEVEGPYLATLQPGVRGAEPRSGEAEVTSLELSVDPDSRDPYVVEELPADPATMDLAESSRILAGGAGLSGAEDFELLARVAAALGAAPGATRVVTDQGWVPHERQIGTTGVTVDPDLYVTLGISGAVQHVAGLGTPRHVVSVNTDPSCPMMAMADLALVTDAPGLLRALARRLGVEDG